jgi:hypothetical protein
MVQVAKNGIKYFSWSKFPNFGGVWRFLLLWYEDVLKATKGLGKSCTSTFRFVYSSCTTFWIEAASFTGTCTLVCTELYEYSIRRKSWTNLEHQSENLESSLHLVLKSLSSQISRVGSLYWTFCISHTPSELSLITSSFLLHTLQTVYTYLVHLWVTLLELLTPVAGWVRLSPSLCFKVP